MNRYAHLKPKTKSFLPTFADPPRWVIVRFSHDKTWSLERNAKTKRVLYWKSESSAQETMRNMARQTSKDKREIRRLYKHELAEIGANNLLLVEPVVLIKPEIKDESVAKKTTSVGCLVDLFEDYEARKFAIASKAGSEAEFVTEIAQAMGSSGSQDWIVRLRETLPLIVDMCCKYRGYKAELVFERRELVAGDLEMPNATRPVANG